MGRLISLSLISSLAAAKALPHFQSDSQNNSLHWHPCGEIEDELSETLPIPIPVECASLPVPLDYTDLSLGTLNLSLLRVNATQEPVLGSVLINPGGPGGSGVESVASGSDSLHAILGGNFNLIGFDPRGTGKTIPFDCKIFNESGSLTRRDITVERNLTEYLFSGAWDDVESYADTCYENAKDVGEFLGTAFVARDMVEIVDALGEGGLLNFWGQSYGTLLGATFAAMFPERVGRLLLDGVVNPLDYMSGYWMTALHDADKAYNGFLSECVDAPEKCAMGRYAGLNTTAEDLVDAINSKLQSMAENSMSGYSILKLTLHQALYSPAEWARTANYIKALLDDEEVENPPTIQLPSTYNEGVNAIDGIKCSDSFWRADSAEEISDVVAEQAVTSSFSDAWYPFTWRCASWKMDAREKYMGDFTAKTKNPILFVGGEHDPVTPVVSAFNTSAGFEDSAVLIHMGYGHTTLAHPSVCTAKAIRSYFTDGFLPETGTMCEPSIDVWDLNMGEDPQNDDTSKRSDLPDEDLKILRSMLSLDRLYQSHPRL